jgi:hypothetical protein
VGKSTANDDLERRDDRMRCLTNGQFVGYKTEHKEVGIKFGGGREVFRSCPLFSNCKRDMLSEN